MERREKEDFVTSLQSAFRDAGLVVVTRQIGLTVSESQLLRRRVREAGANYKIAKNTLVRIAVKGTHAEALQDHLKGPTGISYSEDPIAAAKAVCTFSNDNKKLEIVCGVMNGHFLTAEGVHALAMLPSLDALRGKLIGLIQAPSTKIARILQAPGSQVARVISAYSQKD